MVPLAVEGIPPRVEGLDLVVGYRPPGWVLVGIQPSANAQPVRVVVETVHMIEARGGRALAIRRT